MHTYYEKNKKKYNKDIYKLLSYVKDEVTETFHLDFEMIVKTVQDTFVSEFLADMPYVGGSKNTNDTANLVGGCEYASLFSDGLNKEYRNDYDSSVYLQEEQCFCFVLCKCVFKAVYCLGRYDIDLHLLI